MKKYVFGVDIGGTTCKLGLFDDIGNLLEKWEIETDKRNCGKNVIKSVAVALQEKLTERNLPLNKVIGIGLGLPGTKDKTGVFDCPNLGCTPISAEKEMAEIVCGIKVKALNDANAAALGEMWKGSGMGYQDMVMVTLGTGVGGGIITGGRILEGAHGGAGEIGGIIVNPQETERFIAGPKGCLEQYASATGLVNMTKKRLAGAHVSSMLDRINILTAKQVLDACKEGDILATDIVVEFCRILGKGLARISYVLDSEIFIIGGGVSEAGKIILDGIREAFLEDVPEIYRKTQFVIASLGNTAGIYGAAYVILQEKLSLNNGE